MNRYNVAVLALYTLLTLVLTLPLPRNMNEALAGRSSDVYINPWADWWTKKALTEGLDFYHTDYMFYPRGTSLVFHSFSHANTVISLLLAPLMGHFAAYNVTILLAYVLSGFSMYLLASHLTGCRPAAFIAGFVFAFHPYHIFESAHPVLVTTQWIPLFALALIRMLHKTDVSRVKQTLLAALWFLLTALSSWHLMVMLAGWTVLYLLYSLFFEWTKWAPGAFRSLILLAIVIGLAIAPLLWPIVREQLTTDTAYMAVDVQDGLGNDLLSFFVPNRRHPLFASLVSDINEQIGLIRKRPAYLGYVSLGLVIGGIATVRRKTRFWLLAGLVSLFLSLGSQIRFNGTPLHTFHLPWAAPIISLLRHPFRFNVLLFFSLAVLVGFGSRWLYGLVASRSKPLAHLALAFVAGLLLFEYLVCPFPTTRPLYSPFLYQLAQEGGDFAVADFPMDRKQAKYYLFYQTIHGRRIVDGVVSRTPGDAYAFVDANPLLGPLHARTAPDPDLDVEEQFAVLADQGIRYIIIHKHFLKSNELEDWQRWLANFPPPFYEDKRLIVYRTTSAPNYDLGAGVGLIEASLSTGTVSPDAILGLQIVWGTTAPPGTDLQVEVALVDKEGEVGQVRRFRISPARPTGKWLANTIVRNEYTFQIEPWLRDGTHAVVVGLVREEDGQPVGQRVKVGEVTMLAPERSFTVPPVAQKVEATFGNGLRLLGYDLEVGADAVHVTLHWQALRRMDVDYKMFVHLFDSATAALVSQADVMPRGWTYPTVWWEAGEVVSDEIELPLEGVPPGTYRLGIGVYNPHTGERLAVTGQPAHLTTDEDRLVLPEKVVR